MLENLGVECLMVIWLLINYYVIICKLWMGILIIFFLMFGINFNLLYLWVYLLLSWE